MLQKDSKSEQVVTSGFRPTSLSTSQLVCKSKDFFRIPLVVQYSQLQDHKNDYIR